MSDTSGPHRNEVLEPNVGEMKAELSHIRAQTKQMMGMMQQLLQTKSADEGQQENKLGGFGRGDAEIKAEAPDGHRAIKGPLAQQLEPQQKLLQGEKCPATVAERRMYQDLPTTRAGYQRFQLAWAR